MLKSLAAATAVCALAVTAPFALADPGDPPAPVQPVADAPPPADGPPPDNGVVASEEPGIVTTPDGWNLKVAAKDETQLPIPPLTTSLSSREYLVGGTFTGSVTGSGSTTSAAARWRPDTRSAAASAWRGSSSTAAPTSPRPSVPPVSPP